MVEFGKALGRGGVGRHRAVQHTSLESRAGAQTALEAFAEEMRQRKAKGKMDTKALLAAIDAASSSSDDNDDDGDGEDKSVDPKAAMAVMMALLKKKQQQKQEKR